MPSSFGAEGLLGSPMSVQCRYQRAFVPLGLPEQFPDALEQQQAAQIVKHVYVTHRRIAVP
jgi:hypothetical protein